MCASCAKFIIARGIFLALLGALINFYASPIVYFRIKWVGEEEMLRPRTVSTEILNQIICFKLNHAESPQTPVLRRASR